MLLTIRTLGNLRGQNTRVVARKNHTLIRSIAIILTRQVSGVQNGSLITSLEVRGIGSNVASSASGSGDCCSALDG